jgi:DNA polymerase III alpha subunit (gram-positive type)
MNRYRVKTKTEFKKMNHPLVSGRSINGIPAGSMEHLYGEELNELQNKKMNKELKTIFEGWSVDHWMCVPLEEKVLEDFKLY